MGVHSGMLRFRTGGHGEFVDLTAFNDQLFENYGDKTRIYCYEADRLRYSVDAEGKMRLATGAAKFKSAITGESAELAFSVLHLGDHNVSAGVQPLEQFSEDNQTKLVNAFSQAETAEVIRLLDQVYGKHMFSLRQLFRGQQRKLTAMASLPSPQVHRLLLPLNRCLLRTQLSGKSGVPPVQASRQSSSSLSMTWFTV